MELTNKDKIMQLRKDTQCSLGDIKKALEENSWNVDGALKTLRILNKTKADKVSEKEALEGKLGFYVHAGNKLAVLVELNCQTDFAANSEEFVGFANELAMHIAAMHPKYISEADIPEKDIEEMNGIFLKQAEKMNPKAREKILEGKIKKWKEEVCLLNQKSVRDNSKTIEELREELVGKIRENIKIKRFIRWSVE